MHKAKKEIIKKLISIALALVVGVTFIPLLGDAAFAEGEDASDEINSYPIEINDDGTAVDEAAGVIAPETDGAEADTPTDAEGETLSPNDENQTLDLGDNSLESMDISGAAEMKAMASSFYTLNSARSGSSIILNGSFTGSYTANGTTYKKNQMFFHDVVTKDSSGNLKAIGYCNYKNSLSNYSVKLTNLGSPGYYDVRVYVYDSNKQPIGWLPANRYRVGITAAPSANGSIAVYHNYLDYMSPVDGNLINYKLFLEYNGRVYGPMSYLQSAKITGLAPNSNYGIKTYYGVYKDGSWFTGKEEGYYRNLGTYRTGVGTTPKIKSIKVKATKVKKKTQKVYGYYTGLYLGKRKYYKYSIKITVKLKKAPGTNGIWINGKKFKGNKKKYTVKLGPYTNYSKPKGKKFTVMIYSYYNNSYGGYSPMYRTVKKVK